MIQTSVVAFRLLGWNISDIWKCLPWPCAFNFHDFCLLLSKESTTIWVASRYQFRILRSAEIFGTFGKIQYIMLEPFPALPEISPVLIKAIFATRPDCSPKPHRQFSAETENCLGHWARALVRNCQLLIAVFEPNSPQRFWRNTVKSKIFFVIWSRLIFLFLSERSWKCQVAYVSRVTLHNSSWITVRKKVHNCSAKITKTHVKAFY